MILCNSKEGLNEKPADTEDIVRNFMIEKLDLARDVVDEMKLERVHRLGPFSQNPNYDRNIVYKCNLFADRELVRKRKFKLDKSTYYIHEQFPPEIVAKRRRLVPKLRDAKTEGKSAWISYDTLYVDGKPLKDE